MEGDLVSLIRAVRNSLPFLANYFPAGKGRPPVFPCLCSLFVDRFANTATKSIIVHSAYTQLKRRLHKHSLMVKEEEKWFGFDAIPCSDLLLISSDSAVIVEWSDSIADRHTHRQTHRHTGAVKQIALPTRVCLRCFLHE